MPVPAPKLYPPFNILRFSHAVLNVTDLGRSRDFYVDMLGLIVSDEDALTVHLRTADTRNHHAIVLQSADTTSVAWLGFRTFDEADLARAKAFLVGKGYLARWVERPHQGRTLAFADNQGVPVELHHHVTSLPPGADQSTDHRSDRPVWVDRMCITSNCVAESLAFYNDLGFRVSEFAQDPVSRRLWAGWMTRGAASGGIAFLNGRGPRLHHIALGLATPLGIVDRLDLIAASGSGACLEWGPGRHGPTGALFAYLRDPEGHRIALTCSAQAPAEADVAPRKWETNDPHRLVQWGTPAPDNWFKEGSKFDGVKTAFPALPMAGDGRL